MQKDIKKKLAGFSLVELMVVVAIIAVLSSVAMPRFRTFQAKARQAEAKMNLSHIFTLEQAYQAENDEYTIMEEGSECGEEGNELGFYVTDCSKARYNYEVADADETEFKGGARSGEGKANKVSPGCPSDKWSINQNKVIRAEFDAVKRCNK